MKKKKGLSLFLAIIVALTFTALSVTSCEEPPPPLLKPEANIKTGTYYQNQTVTLSASPPEAQIRYTTNNSEPTESSTLYTAGISITSGTTTLKAKAFKDGEASELMSETYIITSITTAAAGAIDLTLNTFADGSIAAADGTQWFKFTATAANQYIHFKTGTLADVNVQLYQTTGAPVSTASNMKAGNLAINRSLTNGTQYYIRVTPATGTGNFQIAFNTSASAPQEIDFPPPAPVDLTISTWANGNIAAGGTQWFKFTATAATSYIHFDWDTLKSVKVQMYNSTGTTVGAEATMTSGLSGNLNISRATTSGQDYYVRVQPSSGSGNYKLGFTGSTTPPNNTIPETGITTITAAATWTDGNITAAGGEQWFKFTATAATQYIIFSTTGTLKDVWMQLYDSTGTVVGVLTNLYSSTLSTSRTVTSSNEYYIRIRPYSTTANGTYRIGFNTVNSMPIDLPELAATTTLTAGEWADGEFEAAGDENWFTFTASGTSAYFHLEQITSTYVYVQLYRDDGTTVGSNDYIPYSSNNYRQKTGLLSGNTYYVKVTPYSASYVGTYRIAFNTSTTIPNMTMPTEGATMLTTADTYVAGSVSKTSWATWYKFDATAAATYIHFSPDTLTSVGVQMFTETGTPVGAYGNLTTSSPNLSRTTTASSTYFIRVIPYSNSSNGGNFKLAFNTTSAAPSTVPSVPTETATQITAVNTWTDGNIATVDGEQWFKFTSTTTNPYIHFEFGTLTSVYIELYDADGRMMGGTNNLTFATNSSQRAGLTTDTVYYIRVRPYSGSGTFKMAFATGATMPWTAPESAIVTELTNAATWYDGNITSGEQWFKFTTTSSTQYLHFSGTTSGIAGSLTDVYVRMYRASDGQVYNTYRLYGTGSNAYNSTYPSSGVEYYLRVTPNPVTGSGTFKIGFNTSSTRPVTP